MEASAAPVPVRLTTQSSSNGNSLAQQEAPPVEHVQDAGRVLEPLDVPSPHRVSAMTLAALAVVAGIAAIALGMWAFVSSVREGDSVHVVRTAPISGAAQALSLLSKPSTQRIPLRGAGGTAILAVAPGGRAVLVLDGLAIAPIGLTYQAWVVDPSKRPLEHVAAGAFTGVETVVPLAARVPAGWVLGVTVERSGGVPEPSRPFRFGAQRPAG